MPRRAKSTAVPRSEARLFLAKATQYLIDCEGAAEANRHDTVMLIGIHAGISAADAVAVALAGLRSTDQDHHRTIELLEQVAGSSAGVKRHAGQLRELLARKNIVEYESRRATAREAADALRRASRLVAWAREMVDRARV